MKIYISILYLFCALLVNAQAPNIQWQKVFGGTGNERLNKIIPTPDGGYVLCGESESGISGDKTETNYGQSDYWIIKTDSSGNIQWQKDFGGNNNESRPTIIETSDGGFLVGGDSKSNISGNKAEDTHGYDDFWVIKLDINGTIEWQNTIGADFSEILSAIIQTPDGGYLLAGSSVSDNSGDKTENNVGFAFGLPYYTYFDYWVVKLDAQGNILWDNTIGSKLTDGVTVAINASDGGYLIGGYTYCDASGDQNGECFGDVDAWLIKLDTDGSILWQKKYGGTQLDELDSALSTSDGGYLLGLVSKSNASGNKSENCRGEQDFWIVKIDAQGNIVWDKTLGGIGGEYLEGLSEDNQQNFYVTGVSNSNTSGEKTENSRGGYDYWVVKLNPTGSVVWDKTIGGTENEINADHCYNIIDDSLTIAGTSLSSNSGDKSEISRGLADYWLIKLNSDHLSMNNFSSNFISAYPNPTTEHILIDLNSVYKTVHVSLVNTLGQLIFENDYTNALQVELDVDGPKGVYFLKCSSQNNQEVTFKIIKK